MIEESAWIVPPPAVDLKGNEKIVGLGAKVRDFWRFALGDLRMNNARGYLAEFIVGKALGLERIKRIEWEAYDILWGDISIEVKSSAHLQSWDQRRTSDLKFSGLKGTRNHPRGGYDPAGKRFNAMVYVFCAHTATTHEIYDQLQLDQWTFYVIPRSTLQELDRESIGIVAVGRHAHGPTAWADLADAITRAAVGQARDEDANVWWAE